MSWKNNNIFRCYETPGNNYKDERILKSDYNHGFKNFKLYNISPKIQLWNSSKKKKIKTKTGARFEPSTHRSLVYYLSDCYHIHMYNTLFWRYTNITSGLKIALLIVRLEVQNSKMASYRKRTNFKSIQRRKSTILPNVFCVLSSCNIRFENKYHCPSPMT